MTPTAWIALATFALLVLGFFGSGVWYIGRLIGALPGAIATACRDHEKSCANYEPHTSPRMVPVARESEA